MYATIPTIEKHVEATAQMDGTTSLDVIWGQENFHKTGMLNFLVFISNSKE